MDSENQKVRRGEQLRRGEKTLTLLEALSHGMLAAGELCMALSPAYSHTQARGIEKRRASVSAFFADERERHRFHSLLAYLQKTGLVEKGNGEGAPFWRITSKGREKKLTLIKSHEKAATPRIPSPAYPSKKSDTLIIVIFDIPEKEKYKREWLRSALVNLGFKLVQKSVWMGAVQLPLAFIADLKKYNILRHTKIFSAAEIGNLYE